MDIEQLSKTVEPPQETEETSSSHILFIDDDPLIQRVLRKLSAWKVTFELARTVEEGAALLKDERPAAVFIELSLPDMSGDKACQFLKNVPRYNDLPIFLIGEERAEELSETVEQSKADGYLAKPFTAPSLHDFLREKVFSPKAEQEPSPKAPSTMNPSNLGRTVPSPVRLEKADALASIGEDSSEEYLDLELELELPKFEEVDETLARSGQGDEPKEDKVEACLDLGRQKRREALPMLIHLVDEGASSLIPHACWSLGEIGDPQAVEVLIKAVKEYDRKVKSKALEALGKIGAFTAVPKVIDYIPEANDETKLAIVSFLQIIGGPKAKKGLLLLSRDFNSTVSQRAHDALLSF